MNVTSNEFLFEAAPIAAIAVPGIPALLVPLIGVHPFTRRPSELFAGRLTLVGLWLSFLASIVLAFAWSNGAHRPLAIDFVEIRISSDHGFQVALLVDALSLAMMLVTSTIALLVARFSIRYLHREPGFQRYFISLNVFVAGMQLLVLAGTYDLLLVGWELVGLSSILLIAYFRHRPGPVRGGLRAMVTYRVTDVGLLFAAVVVHHAAETPRFVSFLGSDPWPPTGASLGSGVATVVAALLLVSVAGKSALFPLGGWLPRAMEGPTPSSALFYGALSVHAGVYLLLRSASLFVASTTASIAAFVIGLASALLATAAGRVQSDAKNRLAFATMAQVGLMVAAVGLHLWWWVVVHMVAHVCLRLYQLLRAPSALRDAQEMRAALAELPPARPSLAYRMLPEEARTYLYHLALQRFHMDELVDALVVVPVMRAAHAVIGLDDRFRRLFASAPASTETRVGREESESVVRS